MDAIIIDGNNLLSRAFYGIPPQSSPTAPHVPVDALGGFVRMIGNLMHAFPGAAVVSVFDSGRDSFRSSLFPEYKANRADRPSDLNAQIPFALAICPLLGIGSLRLSNIEADDLIASLIRGPFGDHVTRIYSSDKDLLSLVGGNVSVLRPASGEQPPWTEFDAAAVESYVGVTPAQVSDFNALVGDSSDNIPGVPKVGRTSAAALLKEFGNVAGILGNLERVSRPVIRESLTRHADQLLLSARLTTLRTVALPRLVIPAPAPDVLKKELADLGLPQFRFPKAR